MRRGCHGSGGGCGRGLVPGGVLAGVWMFVDCGPLVGARGKFLLGGRDKSLLGGRDRLRWDGESKEGGRSGLGPIPSM